MSHVPSGPHDVAGRAGAICAIAGAKTGAMIGTVLLPGVGTALGGIVGGGVGFIVGLTDPHKAAFASIRILFSGSPH